MLSILSVSFNYSSYSSIVIPFSSGCTIRKNKFSRAAKVQKPETIIKVILQLNSIVEVRKLVAIAPPIFPALPDEQNRPIKIPLPLFPNQLPKIALQEGHPIDCMKPLIENRKQNSTVLLYPSSAEYPIKEITNVTII